MILRSERRHGVCWFCRNRYSVTILGLLRRHRIGRGAYCKGGATYPLGSLRGRG